MLSDIARALGQIGDPRFTRVLLMSVALTIAALFALSTVTLWLVGWVVPDSFALPWIGTIDLTVNWLSWAGIGLLLIASIFLMLPVAFAVIGLFLDSVADAVEARHYPHLPAATPMPLATAVVDGLRFLGIMLLANALALIIYFASTLLAPVIFWAVNGYLLGREYYHLVAVRRLGVREARKLRRAHRLEIWLTGVVLAVPLSVPILNLLVPVIGVAAYCHQFHRHMGRP